MSLNRQVWSAAGCALLVACAGTRQAPDPSLVQTSGEVLLRPVTNPDLELDSSGTVGPQYASGSIDRGFGEYDDQFESSLYLCAATGPVAGPCLAVMGGLAALAGATSSLVYSLQQGATGQSATAATHASFNENPALPDLSARIAARANRLARHLGDPVNLVTDSAACTGSTPVPRGIATLEIAELKVRFEPGYQFQLTVVARLHTEFCGGDRAQVERRLAYLGPSTSMSKDAARASRALDTAVNAAVESLSTKVHAYMREYLIGAG